MERHLDVEITTLKENLLKMAGQVESSIDLSIKALKERDGTLAQQVIDDDRIINDYEVKIENLILTTMARQQPVAADLRLLLASVKINSDLERMGDHAVNISQAGLRLMSVPPLKPLIDVPLMANLVQSMVRDSLDAFVYMDASKGMDVCARDDDVDAIEEQIQRELITYMMQDHKNISACLDFSLIARNLERIADLSTNIGEEVIFVVKAQNIKHQFQDVHIRNS
jgi:phosphate transport system protein